LPRADIYGRTNETASRRWAVTAGEREGSSRLEVLSSLPPLSLVDMLHVTGGGFGT
jgi:hypothetical protein